EPQHALFPDFLRHIAMSDFAFWQYPAICFIHLDGFPAQIHNVEQIPQIVRDDDQPIFSNRLTVQQIYSTRQDWLFPCSFLEAKVCLPTFCTHLRKMNHHKSV